MTEQAGAGNRLGILAISLSMASFVANDAIVKYASQTLPAAQLIFVRGVFASLLLLALAHAMGRRQAEPRGSTLPWRHLARRPVLLRSGLDALGTITYLGALFHLPIANATAINMAAPLFITLFAVLVFREHVGARRWLATVTGFVGVLLVVQPATAGFNAWALLCLLAALASSLRDLVTRTISADVPSVVITVAAAMCTTLLTGLACAFQGWQPMQAWQVALLAGASVFLSCGYFMAVVAMRHGDMSVVAPFRYVAIVYALLIGWLVWGDVPNTLAWAGIALLVGAGLHMVRSGRRPRVLLRGAGRP